MLIASNIPSPRYSLRLCHTQKANDFLGWILAKKTIHFQCKIPCLSEYSGFPIMYIAKCWYSPVLFFDVIFEFIEQIPVKSCNLDDNGSVLPLYYSSCLRQKTKNERFSVKAPLRLERSIVIY